MARIGAQVIAGTPVTVRQTETYKFNVGGVLGYFYRGIENLVRVNSKEGFETVFGRSDLKTIGTNSNRHGSLDVQVLESFFGVVNADADYDLYVKNFVPSDAVASSRAIELKDSGSLLSGASRLTFEAGYKGLADKSKFGDRVSYRANLFTSLQSLLTLTRPAEATSNEYKINELTVNTTSGSEEITLSNVDSNFLNGIKVGDFLLVGFNDSVSSSAKDYSNLDIDDSEAVVLTVSAIDSNNRALSFDTQGLATAEGSPFARLKVLETHADTITDTQFEVFNQISLTTIDVSIEILLNDRNGIPDTPKHLSLIHI